MMTTSPPQPARLARTRHARCDGSRPPTAPATGTRLTQRAGQERDRTELRSNAAATSPQPAPQLCGLRRRRNGGTGLDPGEGAEADGADPRAGHGGAPGRGGRRRRLHLLLLR